jgi:hypothetical protein
VVAKKKKAAKRTKKPLLAARTVHPKSIDDFFLSKTGELRNAKHEMFAQVWVQTFDAREALVQAGYKNPTNRMNLRSQSRSILMREEVQIRVRAILRERVRDMAVTENFVVLKMLDILEKAMAEKPILDSEGSVVGTEYNDLRVALQTLEKLGTNIGMFQKKDAEEKQTVVFNMNYGEKSVEEQKQLTRQAIDGVSKRLQ